MGPAVYLLLLLLLLHWLITVLKREGAGTALPVLQRQQSQVLGLCY